MEVFECILTRRSIRKYLDKPVPKDLYTKVADAGRLAPSSGNIQNWKFIIITDRGKINALAKASVDQHWMAEASVIIVIVGEPHIAKRYYGLRGERLYTVQNCAAATMNMLLCAHSLGLGACWVGAYDEDVIGEIVRVPPEYRIQALIPLGYPDEEVPPPTKYPIEVVAHMNKWRGRYYDPMVLMGFQSIELQKAIKKGKDLLEKSAQKISDKGKELVEKLKKKKDPKN